MSKEYLQIARKEASGRSQIVYCLRGILLASLLSGCANPQLLVNEECNNNQHQGCYDKEGGDKQINDLLSHFLDGGEYVIKLDGFEPVQIDFRISPDYKIVQIGIAREPENLSSDAFKKAFRTYFERNGRHFGAKKHYLLDCYHNVAVFHFD